MKIIPCFWNSSFSIQMLLNTMFSNSNSNSCRLRFKTLTTETMLFYLQYIFWFQKSKREENRNNIAINVETLWEFENEVLRCTQGERKRTWPPNLFIFLNCEVSLMLKYNEICTIRWNWKRRRLFFYSSLVFLKFSFPPPNNLV